MPGRMPKTTSVCWKRPNPEGQEADGFRRSSVEMQDIGELFLNDRPSDSKRLRPSKSFTSTDAGVTGSREMSPYILSAVQDADDHYLLVSNPVVDDMRTGQAFKVSGSHIHVAA